jgi:hypothetical protein
MALAGGSDMKFSQTSEGRLHAGRIAGLMYVVAVVPGCIMVPVPDPFCLMRIIFTAGWWVSFGHKRPARTLSEMAHPLGIIGAIMILLGIAGQFYFAWRQIFARGDEGKTETEWPPFSLSRTHRPRALDAGRRGAGGLHKRGGQRAYLEEEFFSGGKPTLKVEPANAEDAHQPRLDKEHDWRPEGRRGQAAAVGPFPANLRPARVCALYWHGGVL